MTKLSEQLERERIAKMDEFNIAASMEPVTSLTKEENLKQAQELSERCTRTVLGLDATAHSNDEWPDAADKNCSTCIHNGKQMIFRSGCTGCGADGIDYQNYESAKQHEQPSDEYQSWSEVPDDLKWIVGEYPEWLNHHYDFVLKCRDAGEVFVMHCHENDSREHFSRAQWQNARTLYEQLGDEYEQSQHSAEEVVEEKLEELLEGMPKMNDLIESEAWNGEGLPPVGTECEFQTDGRAWRSCSIEFIGDNSLVIRNFNSQMWVKAEHVKFRSLTPALTQAEIETEFLNRCVSNIFAKGSKLSEYDLGTQNMLTALYRNGMLTEPKESGDE